VETALAAQHAREKPPERYLGPQGAYLIAQASAFFLHTFVPALLNQSQAIALFALVLGKFHLPLLLSYEKYDHMTKWKDL
jgi:hypothetical protein